MKLKTCVPEKLPLRHIPLKDYLPLVIEAERILGSLDASFKSTPHPEKVFSLFRTYEALHALRAQDFKTTLEEVLAYELTTKKRKVIKHILNYRAALKNAEKWTRRHFFTLPFVLKTHALINKDCIPSKKGDIGHFRNRQNWIGPKDCTIEEAICLPPSASHLQKPLQNWEKYARTDDTDPIFQMAFIMGQLLTIHPFMDGNGRVARLLIPLFFWKRKLTHLPYFYMSAYFQNRRVPYFNTLYRVTLEKKWDEWLNFFMEGVILEGKKSYNKARRMGTLFYAIKDEILKIVDQTDATAASVALFEKPLFTSESFIKSSKLPKQSALKVLELLKKRKRISLYAQKSKKGKSIYVFTKLIEIMKKGR